MATTALVEEQHVSRNSQLGTVTTVEYCPETKYVRLMSPQGVVRTVPNCSPEMLQLQLETLEELLGSQFIKPPTNRQIESNLSKREQNQARHAFNHDRQTFVGIVHVYELARQE